MFDVLDRTCTISTDAQLKQKLDVAQRSSPFARSEESSSEYADSSQSDVRRSSIQLLRVVCARMMFLCFLFRDFTNIVWEIESRSHDKGRKKEDAAIREQ
jgi:hypothetical protein